MVWPQGRPDLRWKVVYAFAILVVAKLVTVAVPIFFKQATDALTPGTTITQGFGLGAMALIFAYGTTRVFMMVLNQIRDVFFTRVGQHAARELNNRTFQHLHELSLRFHLERRTGGLSRVIERGTRGVELILRLGVLNLVPTALEILLVCGMLIYFFS